MTQLLHRPAARRVAARAAALLLLGALVALGAGSAHAHPLGLPAFARITAAADGGATVVWNAAPDDVAALAASLGVDVAGSALTREQDAALSASPQLAEALRRGIVLRQDGQPCPAQVMVASLVEQGAVLRFTCPDPVREVVVALRLLTDLDQRYRTLGVAVTASGVQRFMFTAASPEHRMVLDPATPVAVGPPAGDPAVVARQPFGGSLPLESAFVALIDRRAGAAGLLVGLLVALGVGAVHGLAPGHGKAIAAAYLVGDRGRPRDAVLLGVVVAGMHTWSVLALGFALYTATQRPGTALLSAWLQLVSGLLVAGLGAWLVLRRWGERRRPPAHHHQGHDHDEGHGHDHGLPADAHPLSWQGLVALGAAGGLLPSPSALLVLFTALAAGRLTYGLGLIAVFSVGLAATVSLVGLAVLRGRDVLRASAGRRASAVVRAAPLVGAAGVAVLGCIIAVRAAGAVLAAVG